MPVPDNHLRNPFKKTFLNCSLRKLWRRANRCKKKEAEKEYSHIEFRMNKLAFESV
jgi:hypothetical protein